MTLLFTLQLRNARMPQQKNKKHHNRSVVTKPEACSKYSCIQSLSVVTALSVVLTHTSNVRGALYSGALHVLAVRSTAGNFIFV